MGLRARNITVAYMIKKQSWKKGCARRTGVLALGLNGVVGLGGGDGLGVHARSCWSKGRGLRTVGVVRMGGGRRVLR